MALPKLVVSCILLVLLAEVAHAKQKFGDTLTYSELSISKEEAICRYDLNKVNTYVIYGLIAAIAVLSVVFLMISIYVFVYIQKYLLKEMDDAVYKAHDVMDAVMVSLIPLALLDEIGHQDKPKGKDD
uniref:Col_cuticle_N domain-containing protein n=1 Tax=Panagrellus redivivus TaxID=6233 RepID=A0A7E4WAF1_PANRE